METVPEVSRQVESYSEGKPIPPFAYHCKFCDRDVTITDANYAEGRFNFEEGNRHGSQEGTWLAIVCPNPDCREYELNLFLQDRAYKTASGVSGWVLGEVKRSWTLIPESYAKPLPDYIPQSIVAVYREACAIRDLSPKASATLSRRCLQGMIRDFWGIRGDRLIDEVRALEGKVDELTWKAIDSVRAIGNIGAHMEKDINVIVDVDPAEAELLIGLIETLIRDWYVVRHDREERLKRLVATSEDKETKRKGAAEPPRPTEEPTE